MVNFTPITAVIPQADLIPQRGQPEATFTSAANYYTGDFFPSHGVAMNEFAGQINLAGQQINDMYSDVVTISETFGNFLGNWSTASGAASPPAAVWHEGDIWVLMQDIADIRYSEPGSNDDYWIRLSASLAISGKVTVASGNVLARAGDDILLVADTAVTVTLPAAPDAGDMVAVMRSGEGVVTVLRNGSSIHGAADDLVLDLKNRRVRLIYAGGTWRVTMEGVLA